jgi:hypothetical protein
MLIGQEAPDQAARYLSQKPNAQDLKIASGIRKVFLLLLPWGFSQSRSALAWRRMEDFLENDYVVLYIHQKQRGLYSKRIEEYVSNRKPEYTVWLNGIEYVRVYALP